MADLAATLNQARRILGTGSLRQATRMWWGREKGSYAAGLGAWAMGARGNQVLGAYRSGSLAGINPRFGNAAARVGAAYLGMRIAAPVIGAHPYLAGGLGLGLMGVRGNWMGMRDTNWGGRANNQMSAWLTPTRLRTPGGAASIAQRSVAGARIGGMSLDLGGMAGPTRTSMRDARGRFVRR